MTLPERSARDEQLDLIKDLRQLVLNYNGPIVESPYYEQLARLLVSYCIIGDFPKK